MEVYFPKFKLEQSYEMKKILPALGITDLFNYQADLSGINTETGLKVSQVGLQLFNLLAYLQSDFEEHLPLLVYSPGCRHF